MKKTMIFVMVLAALALAACGGSKSAQSAQAPVSEPVEVQIQPADAEPVQAEQPAVAEEPAAENSGGDELTSYTAPEDLFTMDVPASWDFDSDSKLIEDSVVESYTAPDDGAFVSVVVNEVSPSVTAVEKGQFTRDYMKRLFGKDLKIDTDVTLKDGREKLEWWSDMNKTSGTTYFDTVDNYLYLVTTGSKDKYEDDYKSILEDVADSFAQ